MRLLSFLSLLLLSATVNAAPTNFPQDSNGPCPPEPEVQTTIETIYETATKTIVHTVTDAPETIPVEVAQSITDYEAKVSAPTIIADVSRITIQEVPEPELRTIADESVLTPCDAEPENFRAMDEPEVLTTVETIFETVTRTVIHTVPTTTTSTTTTTEAPTTVRPCYEPTTEAPTTVRPCYQAPTEAPTTVRPCYRTITEAPTTIRPCNRVIAADPTTVRPCNRVRTVPVFDAPASITQVKMPQCSCEVASRCREESNSEMESCMATCDQHLKEFGNQTGSYLECFQKNDEVVAEAENCLFDGLKDHCTTGDEIEHVEVDDIKKYIGFDFTSEPHQNIKSNSFWRKGQREYSNFQKFFHCTKHCLHKKMNFCVTASGCVMRMPEPKRFQDKMVECTKKNPKIAFSLLKTCQCLAFQKDVKNLIGTCAVVGNPYFVDNV